MMGEEDEAGEERGEGDSPSMEDVMSGRDGWGDNPKDWSRVAFAREGNSVSL